MVFERQKATVRRLIAKYGQACVWRQLTEGVGGTAAKPVAGTPVDHDVTILFLNHKRESLAAAISKLVGTEVSTGGLLGLMAEVDFTPTLRDVVFRGSVATGEQYGIDDDNGIEILAPNDEGALLYKVRFVR